MKVFTYKLREIGTYLLWSQDSHKFYGFARFGALDSKWSGTVGLRTEL